MTTDEKLKHITEITLENTQKECEKSLNEYKARTDKYYNEKMEDARKKAQIKLTLAKEDFIKKNKKEFSNEQISLKRKVSSKKAELKSILKEEVEKQLKEYTETGEYMTLLEKQINEAVRLAAGNPVNIYLDENDEDKKELLEKKTGRSLLICKTRIIGGIVAEIPSKNILMDNSFSAKLEAIMEDYTFKV